jgi:hypothetical protein
VGNDDPYRSAAAKEQLPDDQRRYFTKRGDVVKGPFEPDVLADAVRRGKVKPSTLARAEGDAEWTQISEMRWLHAPVRTARFGEQGFNARAAFPDNGSFVLGFFAGLVGGCIGAILVQVLAKGSDTKRGAWFGFVIQAIAGTIIRVSIMTQKL